MTTGRINQVTTFRKPLSWPSPTRRACPLSRCGVRRLFVHVDPPQLADAFPPRGYKQPQTRRWHHLVSRSHTSRARSPLSRKETKVTALDGDYQRPATPEGHTQTRRIS